MGDKMIIEQWMLDEVEKAKPCIIDYRIGQSIYEVDGVKAEFDKNYWVE
jgi:hypothetical protein